MSHEYISISVLLQLHPIQPQSWYREWRLLYCMAAVAKTCIMVLMCMVALVIVTVTCSLYVRNSVQQLVAITPYSYLLH